MSPDDALLDVNHQQDIDDQLVDAATRYVRDPLLRDSVALAPKYIISEYGNTLLADQARAAILHPIA